MGNPVQETSDEQHKQDGEFTLRSGDHAALK
jgi:hypothetical protein